MGYIVLFIIVFLLTRAVGAHLVAEQKKKADALANEQVKDEVNKF